MPDILIRGMEMPKSCADCHDADLPTAIAWLEAKCPCAYGMNKQGVYDLRHKRHPDCPLVELPPHGDLILKDDAIAVAKIMSDLYPQYRKVLAIVWDQIKDLPVVVPAERRDADA